MKPLLPMSQILVRTYALGAILLLLFYWFVFVLSWLSVEDESSERRISITGPHHLQFYRTGYLEVRQIDPVLTIYPHFDALPQLIKRRISDSEIGFINIHVNDDREYNIYALALETKVGKRTVYAVEYLELIEMEEDKLVFIQLLMTMTGLFLLIPSAFFVVKTAKRISEPFVQVSKQLREREADDYSEVEVPAEVSAELQSLVSAINAYRQNIFQAFEREQSFTRYVSHELRTPMTVARGSLSVLKKKQIAGCEKQIQQIEQAISEMEALTHTFLLLARQSSVSGDKTEVTKELLAQWHDEFAPLLAANQVQLTIHLNHTLLLDCHPVLFKALVVNLLKNAINCSIDGEVSLTLSDSGLRIVDNGVGLNQKARGYEGFGIGLNIVEDICRKVGWQFSLSNNETQGCTADVQF